MLRRIAFELVFIVAAIVFRRSIYPLVLQFTLRRRTVESAKKQNKTKQNKNKTQRQVSVRHDLFTRGSMTAYINSFTTPMTNSTECKMKCFLFWLFYKRNGKRCSCATIELWIHLGGLLSTQKARVALGNSYASSVLNKLTRASIIRWLHAARLPSTFISCIRDTSKLTISVIASSISSQLHSFFKVTGKRETAWQEVAITPVYKRLYGQMGSQDKNWKKI